jgi:hypothetical protein
MAEANDPFERGFRVTQYKIAKTPIWRPFGSPGLFGWDDIYGDTVDAVNEIRELGFLGSQSALCLEMPSGGASAGDFIPGTRDTRYRTPSTYKTAAEKAQEHWELIQRLRTKARLAESDVLWNAAEAERILAWRAAKAEAKRTLRRLKKSQAEAEQRKAEALAELKAAEAKPPITLVTKRQPPPDVPLIRPDTPIQPVKRAIDYERDWDIPCDLLFPEWHDVNVHLARFMAVAEPHDWRVALLEDGRSFIALSEKHFCYDSSTRQFVCGIAVPPGSSWRMFLMRYRLGLGSYLSFTRPRLPNGEERASVSQRLNWQTECLYLVRKRERDLVDKGWPRAAVTLARAFGIRYDGR